MTYVLTRACPSTLCMTWSNLMRQFFALHLALSREWSTYLQVNISKISADKGICHAITFQYIVGKRINGSHPEGNSQLQ
jgi:hypothetical protein